MRALTFGLPPGQLRERAAAQLARLVRDAGTHLGTGFLATPDLLPALAGAGEWTSPMSCCSRTRPRHGSP